MPSIGSDHDADEPIEANRMPAIIALFLASLALIASQIPYGRFGTVGFAAIGLLLAAASWFGARRPVLPASATVLNGLIILIVVLLPSWLGIDSWRPSRSGAERKTVQTFGREGLATAAGDWIDSGQAWQFDDVRVRILVNVAPVELSGPMKKSKWTKESYVLVRVAVANVGVARAFDVLGWDSQSPPRLLDASGKPLPAATFESGWSIALRRKPATLAPGQSVEHDFLFAAPVNPGEFLRLELPGGPCGAAEQTVRFQISTRQLGLRAGN